MTPFFQYVEDVINEKIVVGKYIRIAVERFIKDRDKGFWKFEENPEKGIIGFAEKGCNHWKGPRAGTPIILEPHQHFYLGQKYGWLHPETGLLRFRRSQKLIARKQYKTTEAAVESLYHLLTGVDVPGQVFTCATKEDDAVIVVNDAGRIAMGSPKLKHRFKYSIHEPYVRRVICKNGGFMTYMTKGHDAVDISFGIGDECHDWPDAAIKDRIESAMGNRISPMFSTITTAGFDKSGYCFSTLRATGIKILDGLMEDDEQLILIFELDEGDDWKEQKMWVKANPNLNYSLTHMPYLESQFTKAVNEGGSTEVNFKTKNLNKWVDAPATFIPTEIWNKNIHGLTVEAGEECYGGIEVGTSGQISAFCLLFPGDIVRVKMLFFIAESALNQVDAYKQHRDFIKIDPGNEVENEIAIRWIIEAIGNYNMNSFAFPNDQKGVSIIQELIKIGYQGNPLVQGMKGITSSTVEWEKKLRLGEIEHFGNPVLAYHNSNCTAIRKESMIRIEKNANVLGIYACIDAWAQWKSIPDANDKLIESW